MRLSKVVIFIFPLLGLLAAGYFLLPRVLNRSGPLPQEVTLDYWGLFEAPLTLEPLLTAFHEENPRITVNYERKEPTLLDLEEYKNTLYERLKQGTAPDLFRLHVSWLKEFYPLLKPASPEVFSAEEFRNRFYPVAEATCLQDGSVYAVPLMYDGLALFFNRDLLARAGIESPPTTWEELRLAAQRLTTWEEDRLAVAGVALGGSANVAFAADILGLMFAQSRVDTPDDFNSQAAADALIFYTNFVREDRVWNSQQPYSLIGFANQQVAMIFAPSWAVFDVLGMNPSLNFGTAPVPQVPIIGSETGLTDNTWATFWVEAVAPNSADPEAAWQLLEFLSRAENQQRFYSEAAKQRSFGELYSLESLQENLSQDRLLEPFLKFASGAKTGPICDRAGNDQVVDIIHTAIEAVLAEGKKEGQTASEALSQAKKQLESLPARD